MADGDVPALRVGMLGLGRMGAPMARSLARAGLLAGVWNRSPGKAAALAAELGVEAAATPAALAARCDVLVSIVSDAAAVEGLAAGPDGVLAGLRPGAVWVDSSTTGAEPVAGLAGRAAAAGGAFVDAPVSGSVAAAEAATLMLMVGGDDAAVARARPALEAIGRPVLHLGPSGAGATMKLAVNSLVFSICQAVAESLVLAEAAGVPRAAAYDVLAASAARSPVVEYRRPQFERPEEAPVSFSLQLTAKDYGLILGLAESLGASMPQATLNARIVADAIAAGLGDRDIAAVAEHLRRGGAG